MNRVTALLLSAGYGSRLRPLTDSIPKCLVKIGGQPLLDYWVKNLIRAGIKHASINTHHLRELMSEYIEKTNQMYDIEIIESFEAELLGSAGTVSNNLYLAEKADCVVLIYADNLSNVEIKDVIGYHHSHNLPMTMMLFHTEFPSACGIANIDENNLITEFIEKPRQPASNLANAGVYIMDSEAYGNIAGMNVFDFGFDVLPRYVGQMKGYIHEGYHRDIGTLLSLEQARLDVERGIPGVR